MDVKISKIHPGAIIPHYASGGAACFDLHAVIDMPHLRTESLSVRVPPGDSATFETGLAFEIPAGHVMLVFSRSGHGFKHNVRLGNCVGVIDSDYRGEVKVKLTCDDLIGPNDGFVVRHGDRIAQAMIMPVPTVQFVEVSTLSTTERGAGGFGSTGQ